MNVLTHTTENKETGCLEWLHSVNSAGYGQLHLDGQHYLAHRLSFQQNVGEIPDGQLVRHLCHNKICVNPAHLAIGNHTDNYADSAEKHRNANAAKAQKVEILGVVYLGMRAAQKATGLSLSSLVKYTKDGIFDVQGYRNGCVLARRSAKI